MAHILVIQAAVATLSIIIYYTIIRKKDAGLPLPPGPKPLPIVGNIRDMPPQGKLEYEHWLEFKKKYGGISSVTVLGQPMIILHDRKAIIEILGKNSLRTSNRPIQPFGGDMCGFGSLLTMLQYDDNFKNQRKLVDQQLGTRLLSSRFGQVQDVESRRFLLRVLEDPKELRAHLNTEASAIILKITYGYSPAPQGFDPLNTLVNILIEHMALALVPLSWIVDLFPILGYLPNGFPGAGAFQKMALKCQEVTRTVADAPFELVKSQMSKGTHRPSFVSSAIQQCRDSTGRLSKDDEESIKFAAAIMYGGGAETTASTIHTMILAMMLHPEAQEKAQQEIDNVIGAVKLPRLEDRESLPYVTALVKEIYRWRPIVPIAPAHVTTEEITYGGYRIPKGSYLLPQIWWLVHDPSVYPNPEKFEPERFLSPRNEQDPLANIFGYGRRICPGRFLAEDSVWLTAARLLAVFNCQKLRDEQGREVNFEITTTPGLLCQLAPYPYSITPRSDRHAELIRSVEVDHPWEKGDAEQLNKLLGNRVQDLANKYQVHG
ncbi:o-methylsterigmatocystin oxidoreductase [Paramyrothecium foliicola]|nr:o-methylsterigmatocystin oxidoreductase [Paramyrothecium foliicola]